MNRNKYDNKGIVISKEYNELLELKKDMEKMKDRLNALVSVEKNNVKEDILDLSRKLDNIILKYIFLEKHLKSKIMIKK
ncbi:Spo0E family sporulation regulatory protein-aspartic acid phosphatase [Alkaliphilus sp. MSJ-5]|uniref:Spo0E family sporulation regulatory protein-aspartic acid phosphatase n=1 Tax=Alkaliphilus flagellatus TaxID=2841507 RepID=A0ABS6G4J6_9FIRM|nr:Spo0E family sporulation regulatory protein-aspartic acid phosphatase [Alkaliphilus flagellatus]MBU5676335.1 Spo0E family sporulation regulatory protein-aspartic acid phosphatase [Alkaliphilus flagellatus]